MEHTAEWKIKLFLFEHDNGSTGLVITCSTVSVCAVTSSARRDRGWSRGSGATRFRIRSASVTIPTSRSSPSRTGNAVKPWVIITRAASAMLVDVDTVTTGRDIISRTRMLHSIPSAADR